MTQFKSAQVTGGGTVFLQTIKVCAKLSSLSFSSCNRGVIQRVFLTTQVKMITRSFRTYIEGLELAGHQPDRKAWHGLYNHCHQCVPSILLGLVWECHVVSNNSRQPPALSQGGGGGKGGPRGCWGPGSHLDKFAKLF